MLTDEEIMDIRNRAKLNDNRQIDPMAFARQIECAVLAKLMPIPKQEPVAYGIYAENGNIRVWWRNKFDEEAKAEEWCEANGVDFSTAVSLYDHQQPAQAAAIPDGLVYALKQSQYQIDADGTFIGVSRQALDEAIDIIKSLSASPTPQQSNK